MNKEIFKGKFDQLIGVIEKNWGKLTGDETTQIKGDATRIYGILEEKFGVSKDKVDSVLQKVNLDQLKNVDTKGIQDKASDLLGKFKK